MSSVFHLYLTMWFTRIPVVSHLKRGLSNTPLRRICLRIFNYSLLVTETISLADLDDRALDTQMEVACLLLQRW